MPSDGPQYDADSSNQRRQRYLLVETRTSGHYFEYATYLLQELMDRGCQVVFVTSIAGMEKVLEDFCDVTAIWFQPVAEASEVSPSTVLEIASDVGAEEVLIPSGDKFAYRLLATGAWPRGLHVRVLLLRSPFLSPRIWWRDWFKRCFLLLLERLKPVTVFHLAGPGAGPDHRVRIVRDVFRTNFVQQTPHELEAGWRGKRVWIGIFGILDKRKNIDLVLKALTGLDSSEFGVLLAGEFDERELIRCEEVLRAFLDCGGKARILNRKLTDGELSYAISSVDCVVCAHSNEGPSGIMLRAAAAGKRVLASGSRVLREDSREIPGAVWVPLDVNSLSSGIRDLLSTREPSPVKFSSEDDFVHVFLDS